MIKCANLGKQHGTHVIRTSVDDPGVNHPCFTCKAGQGGGLCFPEGVHPTGFNCSTACGAYTDPDAPVVLDFEPLTLPDKFSDRAVVTLATGDKFKQLLDIARPTFQSYALKCHATYIEIVRDSSTYPEGDKFRMTQLFYAGYREVLFVDADALIMPDTPNLFDLVPSEYAVAIHDDRKYLKSVLWLDEEYTRLIASQGLTSPNPRSCYNTGFMLIRDRRAINHPNPFPRSHTAEQSLINLNIAVNKLKVFELDREWNEQWWWGQRLPARAGTHVYHWASAPFPDRVREMLAMRDGKPASPPAAPRSEFAPCANLGPVIRTDICKPCNGSNVTVRSCDQFGECAPRRYQQVNQPHICDRQCSGFTELVQLNKQAPV